jgi:2'-5' RNA ligase
MTSATKRAGLSPRQGWNFNPHVTLGYQPESVRNPIKAIVWQAREFVPIYSLVGETRHIVLGRWPFVEQPSLF